MLKTAVMVVVVVFMLRCRVGELCGVDGWRGGGERTLSGFLEAAFWKESR